MKWAFLDEANWMSACLPRGTNPDLGFQPFNVTLKKTEAAMYPGLCNGINGILEQIGCTDFLTYCTADLPDSTVAKSETLDIIDTSALKVDLSILPKRYAKPRTTITKVNVPSDQPIASNQHSSSPVPEPGPSLDPSNSLYMSDYPRMDASSAPDESIDRLVDAGEPIGGHAKLSERGLPMPRAECSWRSTEILLEVKLNPRFFPFSENDVLSDGADHVQSRGQLALYALQVFRTQHRRHIFLISICGKGAWLVRFDRSGAIVSKSIDYTTKAGATLIGRFLYSLFHPSATPEERGADPTATLATDEEAKFFCSLHKMFQIDSKSLSRIGKHFQNAAADGTWPIYVLNITSRWSQVDDNQNPLPVHKDSPIEMHRCLVGKPMFTGRSVEGRGTKCFVGWDIDGRRPVMIKDSWRADLHDVESELDTYTALWEGEIPNITATYIPTPLGGGDVYCMAGDDRKQYQRTLDITAVPVLPHTPEPRRLPRIHTRLVLKEICEPLEAFTDAHQLVGVIFNALLAHYHAWEKHKMLHRDISVHNILIYYSEHIDDSKCIAIGLLSDWDLARTERQLQQGPILPWRSGTWQSMSALLQFWREKQYEVSDDLESFMHVLNWCALRFLPNEYGDDPVALGTTMFHLFDHRVNRILEDGAVGSGGALLKLSHVRKGKPFAPVDPPDHPFNDLLKKLAVLCQQHYATYDIDQIIANSGRQEGQDQSAKPQVAKPEPPSTYLDNLLMTSKMRLPEWLSPLSESAASLGKPTTPTRVGSSLLPSASSQINEMAQSRHTIVLNSPPPTSKTRAVKDRSESPLLDHRRFMQAIWETLGRTDIQWDLLPKRKTPLEPPNATKMYGSSTGSGSKRRSAGGDDERHVSAKRQKSSDPSPARGSSSESDDPFLDNSSAVAAPGIREGAVEPEGEQNVATRLFKRANQTDSTRTSRHSSRRSSPRATPSSSRSASPTA